jgi:diguanylate cyclase (GGDEF)-like protein
MTAAFRTLLRPEPLLFIAAVVVARWIPLERAGRDLVLLAPSAAALAALLVAWPLKRSRLVFASAGVSLASLVVSSWAPADGVAFQVAAGFLAVTLAAVALLPERGVFTTAGLWMWTGLAILAAIAYVLIDAGARDLTPDTLHQVLQPDGLGFTPIGRLSLLAFGTAAVLVGAARWFAPGTTGRGYLWSLGAALLAFHAGGDAVDRGVYLTAALAIPVVAAIQASYVLAYHDGLTGLPGRRALDDALTRLSGTYTVAMVDVDHFKQFNDAHGHDVGDQVLRTVATRLREALGEDQVFRYGGEEFAVLLAGRSLADSLSLLEKARAAVASEPFAIRAKLRPRKKPKEPRPKRRRRQENLTVSIGAAEPAGRHSSPEQVIKAADQALYRAKEGGRNQVQA